MKKAELEKFLSPIDLESQEHLSKQLLLGFVGRNHIPSEERPKSNFVDLMNWVKRGYSHFLYDKPNYPVEINKLIHNRIIIDGQFIQFSKENNIHIECLYKDSIVSWTTENNFEKFFVQGIFRIESKDVQFIHCALFHKGTQNEDEISFFVLVSDDDYEEYIKLRNAFDRWVQKRDRGNLFIRVVGGDDIAYTKDNTWDDLFLPKEIKSELKNLIESFLVSKDFYLKNKIPWKRGILLWGYAGCGKTSIIRTAISEYDFKPVTINPGASDSEVREAFSYAEEQSPSLLYFEDLDSLLEKNIDASSFLNLMDGICARNGLLIIATANEIRKLKANITNRPSRFDRKFEIPLPDKEMADIYLKKWFGSLITAAKCKSLAEYSYKNKFSYAHLKELYISSMFEALSHNRKSPTVADIDSALNYIVKDKNCLNKTIDIDIDNYLKP